MDLGMAAERHGVVVLFAQIDTVGVTVGNEIN